MRSVLELLTSSMKSGNHLMFLGVYLPIRNLVLLQHFPENYLNFLHKIYLFDLKHVKKITVHAFQALQM
jgi:hypothetical protein